MANVYFRLEDIEIGEVCPLTLYVCPRPLNLRSSTLERLGESDRSGYNQSSYFSDKHISFRKSWVLEPVLKASAERRRKQVRSYTQLGKRGAGLYPCLVDRRCLLLARSRTNESSKPVIKGLK